MNKLLVFLGLCLMTPINQADIAWLRYEVAEAQFIKQIISECKKPGADVKNIAAQKITATIEFRLQEKLRQSGSNIRLWAYGVQRFGLDCS